MTGYEVVEIPSNPEDGCVDLSALEHALSERTAVFMLTNPNTLGIFEHDVLEIARMVHEVGALLYYDGANLNAIMGWARPGDMGYDIVHFNLHKTFGTPHGGGGPGAGPIGVKKALADFLPVPVVAARNGRYYLDYEIPHTIGRVKAYYGNFNVLLKAYVYIKLLGGNGLREASEIAVLNSNYMKEKLLRHYTIMHKRLRKHEFVISPSAEMRARGIRTIDIAKRLMDFGFHAPTIYFPLIVDEALMIEPTENEPKEEIDKFIDAMIKISEEDAEVVKGAPHNTSAARLDEVGAARKPVLSWKMYLRSIRSRTDEGI
jgi:glycine dehydrogenase subunit 2